MKAAVLHAPHQPMTIEDVVIDKPKRREVLVRVAAAGLCHSDLHFIEGAYPTPMPVVLGHESAGVVEAVGEDVTYVKPGDHVISCLSVFCGHCEFCLSGHLSICQTPEVKMPPGVAQRLSWQGRAPEPVPQPVVVRRADAGPRARAREGARGHAARPRQPDRLQRDHRLRRGGAHGADRARLDGRRLRRRRHRPGDDQRGAQIAGAGRIIAIDKDPFKLGLAKAFGATDVIDAAEGDTVKRIVALTGGGVHYSFECIGLKATAEQSFSALRSGGTATLIGMIPVGTKIELHGVDFLRERRIQGCMMGSNRFRTDMPRLIEFYLQGRLHLAEMVSARIKLEQINEGFAALKTGGIARNVIVFDS